MSLVSISISHRTAPVEVREALSFDGAQVGEFLRDRQGEMLLISTCNRTELAAIRPAEECEGALLSILDRARPEAGLREGDHAVVRRGADASRHLVRVSCGLESMVLGEAQVLGQVKEAGRLAKEAGTLGSRLRRALDTSVKVAKRARTETRIGEGAVSVASASVELVERIYDDLPSRTAMVIGAGDTGRLVAQHLSRAGMGKILLASRTLDHAREVADQVSAEASGLCGVPPGLRQADVVVSCTSAREPILTRDEVKAAMRARKERMILVLDIAVPRDVEPSVGDLPNVFLHDVDTLKGIVDKNLEIRKKAILKVEEMVEEAVSAYGRWEKSLTVVPTIKALRARFEEIRRSELDANLKRIPPEAREAAERLTTSLLNRLLHQPTARLKQTTEERNGVGIISAARELFGIEEEEDE